MANSEEYEMNRYDRNPAPTKLWLLIEFQSYNGKSSRKNYEIFESKDVYGAGGPDNPNLDAMHTGKVVYIRKNKVMTQGIIYTISDDKSFLDQELKDLRELAMAEMTANLPQKKRRREVTPKTENSYSPYQNWNVKSEIEGTSSQTISMAIRPVVATTPQQCPPMTFDQQTQTDIKFEGASGANDTKLNKLIKTTENIVQSQSGIALENQQIKQQVTDLSKQLVEMKSMLSELLNKLNRPESQNGLSGTDKVLVSSLEPYTPTSNRAQFNQPKILNLSHHSNSQHAPATPYNNSIVEPVEASNDSTNSYTINSRMSHYASNQSIYQNDYSPNRSNGDHSENKVYVQSIKIERLPASQNNLNEFNVDNEGRPEDDVVIGNNNTTIPRHVLTNINWNSHTSATRRLLKEKFSRDVLATHSLTGKPSPAFMDLNKPTKSQLDPQIIADIVQYVSKRCRVTDTVVRSSITTKCADENKMMRQRMEKERQVLVKLENKENVANNRHETTI